MAVLSHKDSNDRIHEAIFESVPGLLCGRATAMVISEHERLIFTLPVCKYKAHLFSSYFSWKVAYVFEHIGILLSSTGIMLLLSTGIPVIVEIASPYISFECPLGYHRYRHAGTHDTRACHQSGKIACPCADHEPAGRHALDSVRNPPPPFFGARFTLFGICVGTTFATICTTAKEGIYSNCIRTEQ